MTEGRKKIRSKTAVSQDGVFFEEVTAFLLLTVVLAGLLWQGLLFESQAAPIMLLMALLSAAVILKARLTEGLRVTQPFVTGLFALLAAAAGFALLGAVNPHNAVFSLGKHGTLLLLVLAVQVLNRKIPVAGWLTKGLILTGLAVAFLGLDGVWGGRLVQAAAGLADAGPISESSFFNQMLLGDRLASVFQYPNTTAAYLLAAWFAAVHRYIYADAYIPEGRRRAGAVFATAGAANVFFLSFILTISRGMYLVAVPALALYFFLLPAGKRARALPRYLVCFVPGLILGVLSLPGAILRERHWSLSWLLLAAVCAIAGFTAQQLFVRQARQVQQGGRESAAAVPRRLWGKPLLPLAVAAAAFLLVAALAAAWGLSLPYALEPGRALIRQFDLTAAGDYQCHIRLAEPLAGPGDQLYVRFQAQDRQEMLQGRYTTCLETDLAAYAGQQDILLPFRLPRDNMHCLLSITKSGGATAAGSEAGVSADAAAAAQNAVISLSLATGGETVREIRLSRPVFSEDLIQRIENIFNTKSMYDRFGFYLDAAGIFLDYPLTGIGGGGWSSIYYSYQKFPYVSNDIHSYGVQLIVEFGLGGLLALLGFFACLIVLLVDCLRAGRQEDILVLILAGVLFGHSLIDVDFTFFGQYAVFALILASAQGRDRKAGDKLRPGYPWKLKYGGLLRDGLMLLTLALACFWPFRFLRAESQAEAYFASLQGGHQQQAFDFIAKAAANDPFKPEYKAAAVIQLVNTQGKTGDALARGLELAAAAERQGRFNVSTLNMLADFYFSLGRFDAAFGAGRRLSLIDPYSAGYWQKRGELTEKILAAFSGPAQASERRYWLEKGVSIGQEMAALSADRWTPVEPAADLAALLAQWQAELASWDN